jgi:aryl-alcohol dehydrogenase-like predicted oxidoreductase
MISGYCTAEGTARYAARFPGPASQGFYRQAGEWLVSSLGIGTYLGAMTDETDRQYAAAVQLALRGGINFIDTSLNYRLQRSERAVAAAVKTLTGAGEVRRDEFAVCTKAGFLAPKATPKLKESDIAGGIHSMAPAFLTDQLERSRTNLNLETIDVYYLHNPETQLSQYSPEEVYRRFHEAFAALEGFVEAGRIRCYGAATWQAFREKPGSGKGLSLARLLEIARAVGGASHHFRFVQLPFNLAMPEVLAERNETRDGVPSGVLDVAARGGVTVVASAALLQARLARNLPPQVAAQIPGGCTDAQRAIQFARSAPGITVALVGMSKPEHVRENLEVAEFPPAPRELYAGLVA